MSVPEHELPFVTSLVKGLDHVVQVSSVVLLIVALQLTSVSLILASSTSFNFNFSINYPFSWISISSAAMQVYNTAECFTG